MYLTGIHILHEYRSYRRIYFIDEHVLHNEMCCLQEDMHYRRTCNPYLFMLLKPLLFFNVFVCAYVNDGNRFNHII